MMLTLSTRRGVHVFSSTPVTEHDIVTAELARQRRRLARGRRVRASRLARLQRWLDAVEQERDE